MTKLTEALQPFVLSASANQTQTRFKYDAAADETREIRVIASAFDAAAKEISADVGLTEIGSQRKCSELAAKTLEQLEAWEKKIPQALSTRIEVEIAALRRKFAPEVKLDPAERLVREIRESEIRRSLEGVDPTMLELKFGSLDVETRAAIRNAPLRVVAGEDGLPTSKPLVPAEAVDNYDDRAMAEVYPDERAQIQELEDLRGTYEMLARVVRTELQKAIIPEDSVEELAAAAGDGE